MGVILQHPWTRQAAGAKTAAPSYRSWDFICNYSSGLVSSAGYRQVTALSGLGRIDAERAGYCAKLGQSNVSRLTLGALGSELNHAGVIVFSGVRIDQVTALFDTNSDSNFDGFYVKVDSSGSVAIDKRANSFLLASTNRIYSEALNTVAWCESGGNLAIALNGVLTTGTYVTTFTAGTWAFGSTGVGEFREHNQFLSAVARNTTLTGAQLVSLSLNPWQLFAPPARKLYFHFVGDTTPNAFTFTDQTGVVRSAVTTSNTLTVAGINATSSVSVTGAGSEWQKNGGSWTSAPGTVVNGDTFAVRHLSSAQELTTTDTTLNIGGVSDVFTSTTAAFVRILLAKQLNNEGSLPTFTLTGANQPVAGRKLYVGIGAWNGVGAVGESVTDSKSNSYTRKDSTTAVSNTRVQLYGCDYAGTGDVTITVGRGAGNWTGVYSYLFCIEIDGLMASEVDTSANGQATGSTSGTDASVTGASAPLQSNNVLIAMMAVNTSDPTANVTNPTGWTGIMTENDGSANECGGAAFRLIPASAAPTAAWTYDDTGAQWQAAVIVLRQLGGGGGGGARRAMMMGVG